MDTSAESFQLLYDRLITVHKELITLNKELFESDDDLSEPGEWFSLKSVTMVFIVRPEAANSKPSLELFEEKKTPSDTFLGLAKGSGMAIKVTETYKTYENERRVALRHATTFQYEGKQSNPLSAFRIFRRGKRIEKEFKKIQGIMDESEEFRILLGYAARVAWESENEHRRIDDFELAALAAAELPQTLLNARSVMFLSDFAPGPIEVSTPFASGYWGHSGHHSCDNLEKGSSEMAPVFVRFGSKNRVLQKVASLLNKKTYTNNTEDLERVVI